MGHSHLSCSKLSMWTSITLYMYHTSISWLFSLLQKVLALSKHRQLSLSLSLSLSPSPSLSPSLLFRKIPNVCKRSTKGPSEAWRETKGYKGEHVCTSWTRLYFTFYVSFGWMSSIFSLISVPFDPIHMLKVLRGRNCLCARWHVPKGKNCARKSSVVERITFINWRKKVYLKNEELRCPQICTRSKRESCTQFSKSWIEFIIISSLVTSIS